MARYTAPTRPDWVHWLSYAQRGRDPYRAGRPICNKTRAFIRSDEAVAIRHHCTDIITYYKDGSVEIRNGGWYSKTTQGRLNAYLPNTWAIVSRSVVRGSPTGWYLSLSGYSYDLRPEKLYCFYGSVGMRVAADGTVSACNGSPVTTFADDIAEHEAEKLKRKQERMAKTAAARLIREKARRIERKGRTGINYVLRHGLLHLLAEGAQRALADQVKVLDGRELRSVVLDDDFAAEAALRTMATKTLE